MHNGYERFNNYKNCIFYCKNAFWKKKRSAVGFFLPFFGLTEVDMSLYWHLLVTGLLILKNVFATWEKHFFHFFNLQAVLKVILYVNQSSRNLTNQLIY